VRGHHRARPARARPRALTSSTLAPQFPALDSIRALGALCVLTTHATFNSGDYVGNGWLGTFLSRLDIGVALFFVLSGFLLSRPWIARRVHALPPPRIREYFWKRLVRIYPAYAVTVVIAMLFLSQNRDASARDWLVTLTLSDIYVEPRLPAGLTQMWSLSTEVAFYVLLPLLMPLLLGRRGNLRPAVAVGGLTVMVAISAWWSLDGAWSEAFLGSAMPLQWLPGYLSWFATGIGLAMLHVLADSPERSRSTELLHKGVAQISAYPGASALAAVGLLLVVSTPLAGPALLALPTPEAVLTKQLLYVAISFLVVVPAIFGDPASRYGVLLAASPLRHLGHISYSVFCIHLSVLHLVMWWGDYPLFGGNGLQIWFFTLVFSLTAAELLYRAVELPALRLRGLLARPLPVATTTNPTATTTSVPGHVSEPAQPSEAPQGRQA